MLVWKRLARSRSVQRATGVMAAEYLRLVWITSRFVTEPADVYDRMIPHMPVILTMWHGQHFLMPFIRRPEHRGKVLISRHKDGEINAIAAERLGIETIRGSGAHGRDFDRKGGAPAFMEMLSTLKDGLTVGYDRRRAEDFPRLRDGNHQTVAGLRSADRAGRHRHQPPD